MDLDLKVVSKEINEILWRNHKTLQRVAPPAAWPV